MPPPNEPPRPWAPPPEQIRVWLVEDDDLFRDTIYHVVNFAEGMCCERAFAACEAALAALEQEDAPHVLLMDIGLPGLSGIEGVARVRARAPMTGVIMLTVQEDTGKIFDALCAGAAGYLLKPSSVLQITEAIRSVRRGGAPINPQIARKVLDAFTRQHRPPEADPYGLTERERETLQHLVDGFTYKEIAARLYVSYHTIDMHVRNIYAKLHVRSRSSAVAKALREGLL